MNSNLLKIKSKLKKNSLDALLISSASNIIYLTGFPGFSSDEREAFLLILKNKQYVLTDGRYKEEAENKMADFELIELSHENKFEKALADLVRKHNLKKLGIEEENLAVSEYKKIKIIIKNLKDFNLNNLRVIKNESEIENIKKACFLTDRTFKYILEQIKPGITEKKLVLLIELFIRENNADIAFPPICAFGNNSSIPHHQPNDQRLKSNDQILLDFGAKINNYCSDMTRTVFLGKAKGEQKRIYRTVLKAQKKAIEFLASNLRLLSSDTKPLKTSSLDQVARSYIISEGFPAIPHSLGHGIGIEVHEGLKISPKSKDVIKPGMVFSIEPGIYLPNIGGVRIEDLVLVNGKGIQILTSSPRHLIEL